MIKNKKIRLEYLPPYSPDFNSIEYLFLIIKRSLKKEEIIVGDETDVEFAKKIVQAAALVVTPSIAKISFAIAELE